MSRVSQSTTLVLAGKDSDVNVSQSALLVLWGTGADIQVSQSVILVAGRPPVRRTIGITD